MEGADLDVSGKLRARFATQQIKSTAWRPNPEAGTATTWANLPTDMVIQLTTDHSFLYIDAYISRVQAVLAAEPDLGSIERETQDTDVRMRLLKPLIEVELIRRSRSRVGETDYYQVAATLQVLGTLEITVTVGEIPPEGVIERIEYDVGGYARAGSIIPAGTEDR